MKTIIIPLMLTVSILSPVCADAAPSHQECEQLIRKYESHYRDMRARMIAHPPQGMSEQQTALKESQNLSAEHQAASQCSTLYLMPIHTS